MSENEDIQYDESYVKRRIQQNKQERKLRKTNQFLLRLKVLFRLITIVLIIFSGYKLLKLPQWYMDKNAFNTVENPSLEILDNKIVPDYYILAALRKASVPNLPIFLYKTDDIKANIMMLDPVQDVVIRRFWFPARLQIIIQERTPAITIAPDEKVEPIAFFAKGGKLIGRDYLPLDSSYKTVRVLTYGVRGDDYRHWDGAKVALIEKLAKAISVYTDKNMEYIDLRIPNDAYIKLEDIKIRLGKLDDSVFERIKRISSLMPQVIMLDKKIKYVDLRWNDATFIKLEE